ncbi:TetR/AcrR family transcriptional regulator [Nocardioides sp.]|uniref:TetR/AcrR family transcriptional regulator n=1 Tax=Nocardioides sp. TaxID=35761 RepID=UPI002619DA9F|nr:TetR/AcrR family transcriptional regulator [Nocardioides sp.]
MPTPAPALKPVSDRPRSQNAHTQVLIATSELLDTIEFDKITVERIAARSGVSTATIYKHWPSKLAIVAEAFGRTTASNVPIEVSADPRHDLVTFAVASMTYHGLPSSRVFVQLIAACAVEPSGAAYLAEYYLGPRRDSIRPLWNAAVEAGAVRDDLDFDLAMDVLFGASVFRLMRGCDDTLTRAAVEASLAGLLR